MKALTSDSLNIILFELNKKSLKDFGLINLNIEIQTTFIEEALVGVGLKWRIIGSDKANANQVFHYLVEHTFDNPKNLPITIENTSIMTHKSYVDITNELQAQMIKAVQGTIKLPPILDNEIVERVHKAILPPKK